MAEYDKVLMTNVKQIPKLQTSKIDYSKVLNIFEKRYVLVPLEVFGDDPYKTLISTLSAYVVFDHCNLIRSFE